MGKFIVKSITHIADMKDGDTIPESDYSLVDPISGKFIQFKYQSESNQAVKYDAKPGLYKITKTMTGFVLEPTFFTKDEILEEFLNTQKIQECIDSFVNNIHLYKEFGYDVARRNMLIWGAPGCGKSTAINKVVGSYVADGTTLAITWDTNAYEAYEIKSFIANFNYIGVSKVFVIAEDIGGMENEGVRVRSDSSLLSLLDNSDKTFTLPTMIISTTNHPSNLDETLANRNGRFDDKIEAPKPDAGARAALLKFFSKGQADEAGMAFIQTKECEKFPTASIKEAWIRSKLRNKPLVDMIKEVKFDIDLYEKAFEARRRGMGI